MKLSDALQSSIDALGRIYIERGPGKFALEALEKYAQGPKRSVAARALGQAKQLDSLIRSQPWASKVRVAYFSAGYPAGRGHARGRAELTVRDYDARHPKKA